LSKCISKKYFQLCIDGTNQALPLSNVKPKISYAEASKYFEQKEEEREKQSSDNNYEDIKDNLSEDSFVKVQYYIKKILNISNINY